MNRAHQHTLLLVDDNVDLLGALSLSLTLAGSIVHTASSGHDALEMIAAGLCPCIVVLDIRMPVLDGWQVHERMRAVPTTAATPVVMLSGELPDQARAERAGVQAYLRKPVTHETLIDTITRHCSAAPLPA